MTAESSRVHVCSACRHMRTRAKIVLFHGTDLQSSGALKAETEWDQQERQRAQLELQRYQSRQPFEYEPHNYPWCAKLTRLDLVTRAQQGDADALEKLMQNGGATMNPVSGELTALYQLCAWHNENGDCADYEHQ